MRTIRLLLVVGIFLLVLRIIAPYALLHYAEYRINQIPEYKVKIKDLDLHLYRGSYTIKQITLYKTTKTIPVPFFKANAIDLSLEWKALLRGAIVAKIIAYQPEVNFVMDAKGQNEQLSINKEWKRAVKALFPLNINLLKIVDGKLTLRSFTGHPPFNLFLKDINFEIANMQKIRNEENLLSSNFNGNAVTMDGSGQVNLRGRFDPFSKKPLFDFSASVENMQINAANNFLKHFTSVDVKHGNFSLFVEAAAAQGKIKGYAKPIVKNLQIYDSEKDQTPLEALWEGALDVVAKIVTNPNKKTVATKIYIEGQIDEPQVSVLSIIGNVLRHAFIQALLPQIDHSVAMRDVLIGKSSAKTS